MKFVLEGEADPTKYHISLTVLEVVLSKVADEPREAAIAVFQDEILYQYQCKLILILFWTGFGARRLGPKDVPRWLVRTCATI